MRELKTERYILSTLPALYLPLYKLDGSSFISKDAHGHLCTVTGALWILQGRSFDGNDDDVRTTTPPFSTNESGTLIWWEKSSALTGYSPCYSDIGGTVVDEFRIIHNANGSFDIDVLDGGVNTVVRTHSTGLLTTTTFSFVAVISNGSAWSAYHGTPTVAPTLQTLDVITGSNSGDWFGDLSLAETFAFGGLVRSTGLVADWAGIVGEAYVYSRVPVLAELTQIWQATKWRYQ